jgi:membrane-bound metal-dependent hydrolase YbcI (DUF457 family)
MAQAGIHGLVGLVVKKWAPEGEGLALGILLGSLFPDTDNLLVAIATVLKRSTEGLHRTITHSLLFAAAVLLVFLLIGKISNRKRWSYLGIGLAIGITLHSLLDLLIWFNGVSLFWPLPLWVNLWTSIKAPAWFDTLMNPLEFLFLAAYFFMLIALARKQKTNGEFLKTINIWLISQVVLFIIFLPLLYSSMKLAYTIYGVFYLISLFAALVITVKMKATIEYRA